MRGPASIADTIVAQSSAPGSSLRALLRVSGDAAPAALQALGISAPLARGVSKCVISIPAASTGTTSFAAWLLWLPGPHSYTGQATAELVIPGNPALSARVLQAMCSAPGVRLAEAGEFSARAYMAGKLTLEQAEGIAATIAAQNASQLGAARTLAQGSTPYAAWYDEALTLLALVEAGIDFTDQEDVVPISPAALAARLDALMTSLREFLGAARGVQLRDGVPVVSLVGAPNAGKSTLFNALLRRQRAVASPVAGTTRDVLRELLDLASWSPGAGAITLQDCPGLDLHPANDIERQAQANARAAAASSDSLLWCDASGVFDEAALAQLLGQTAAWVREARPRIVNVRTCADRAGAVTRLPLQSASNAPPAHAICALTGAGVHALMRELAGKLSADVQAGVGAVLPRHRSALVDALKALARVHEVAHALAHDHALQDADVLAADLRSGAASLGLLAGGSGTISPEEVLGKIFSTFCVGK